MRTEAVDNVILQVLVNGDYHWQETQGRLLHGALYLLGRGAVGDI